MSWYGIRNRINVRIRTQFDNSIRMHLKKNQREETKTLTPTTRDREWEKGNVNVRLTEQYPEAVFFVFVFLSDFVRSKCNFWVARWCSSASKQKHFCSQSKYIYILFTYKHRYIWRQTIKKQTIRFLVRFLISIYKFKSLFFFFFFIRF